MKMRMTMRVAVTCQPLTVVRIVICGVWMEYGCSVREGLDIRYCGESRYQGSSQ
jgi:hypothetical protein